MEVISLIPQFSGYKISDRFPLMNKSPNHFRILYNIETLDYIVIMEKRIGIALYIYAI